MAKLKKCGDCGQEISKKAKSCPNCGAPAGRKQYGCGHLIFVLVLLGTAGWWIRDTPLSSPTQSKARTASTGGKEIAWVENGKSAVRTILKDPESAQFRNVYFSRGLDDIPVACGEVNSKNSLGGYTGYQRFVSAGTTELTYLEGQVADFDKVWAKFCTRTTEAKATS